MPSQQVHLTLLHSLILTLPNIPSRSLPRSSSRTPPGLVPPGPHKVTRLVTTNKLPMLSVLTTTTSQPQSLSRSLHRTTMALLTTHQATLATPLRHLPTNNPPGTLVEMASQVAKHGAAPSSTLDNQALPPSSNLPMASILLSIHLCRKSTTTTAPWLDMQALSLRLTDLVLANLMLSASL